MHAVGTALYLVLVVFLVLLLVRGVMSWVLAFSRYRPAGGVAAVLEVAYTATDPVLRPLERWIKPVRIGRAAISLSYPIAWITTIVLMQVVRGL
ncbi:MAG TPA: YggT family protein [Mycobacteriales bacterium]